MRRDGIDGSVFMPRCAPRQYSPGQDSPHATFPRMISLMSSIFFPTRKGMSKWPRQSVQPCWQPLSPAPPHWPWPSPTCRLARPPLLIQQHHRWAGTRLQPHRPQAGASNRPTGCGTTRAPSVNSRAHSHPPALPPAVCTVTEGPKPDAAAVAATRPPPPPIAANSKARRHRARPSLMHQPDENGHVDTVCSYVQPAPPAPARATRSTGLSPHGAGCLLYTSDAADD